MQGCSSANQSNLCTCINSLVLERRSIPTSLPLPLSSSFLLSWWLMIFYTFVSAGVLVFVVDVIIVFLFFSPVLGIEPQISHMLRKYFITGSYP